MPRVFDAEKETSLLIRNLTRGGLLTDLALLHKVLGVYPLRSKGDRDKLEAWLPFRFYIERFATDRMARLIEEEFQGVLLDLFKGESYKTAKDRIASVRLGRVSALGEYGAAWLLREHFGVPVAEVVADARAHALERGIDFSSYHWP